MKKKCNYLATTGGLTERYNMADNRDQPGISRSASFTSKATPIKCLDLDDTNGQLKLEGWLYIVLIVYTHFNEEAPFYWGFGRGGIIFW